MHGGLQPQGVPCPQAAGGDTAIEQKLPELLSVVGVEQQLGTVFAGVARASTEHRLAQALEVEHPVAEAGQAAEVFAAQLLQQTHGLRALQSEQHSVLFDVGHRQASGLHLFTDPGGVAVGAGGIDHQHQRTPFGINGTAVVNDEVVANAAALVQQNRVAGFAGTDAVQVAGDQPLQRILGIGTFEAQHSHVGNIEHADPFANGLVLLDQAAELNRHLPAGKRHHAAPGAAAGLEQGSALQGHGGGR